ncbi:MAG: S-layer homology domain-containing protein [Oscillospiraceae bacterium]
MSKRLISVLLALVICIIPASAYYNVPCWAEQSGEFYLSEQSGLIPPQLGDADMSSPVTRREFCYIAVLGYEKLSGQSMDGTYNSIFSDVDDNCINAAVSLGIVQGYPDGTFKPDNNITREEIFMMLRNLLCCFGAQPELTESGVVNVLSPFPDWQNVQTWARSSAASAVSLGIVNGNNVAGTVVIEPRGLTTRAQALVMAYRLTQISAFSGSQGDVITPGTALAAWGPGADSSAKWAWLMGSAGAPKYKTYDEAIADMVQLTVNVWDFNSSGEKVPATRTFLIHYRLAPTVKQIFKEIYESPEKFPIHNITGFSWREGSASEHNWGCAIDINWEENYYINLSTGSSVGNYWQPGTDPYSIPSDGSVVAVFHKYGFGWGGDGWWRSVRDYMHFSFMST